MFKLGMGELVVILVIVLVLFGAKRLPEIARALGKSINEFKKGTKEINDEIEKIGKDEDKTNKKQNT